MIFFAQTKMNIFEIIGNLTYFGLAAVAIWGAFCVVIAWNRVRKNGFGTKTPRRSSSMRWMSR